ncbi:bifunctional DNA primase/polymerase [Sphaerisporangium flaviroseum]|uniref:bifunctional DNA primase/polymerase n=1 Tax=Sphaerisporangium flaviroseum TaxID=509199 RepID=UPI0031E5B428
MFPRAPGGRLPDRRDWQQYALHTADQVRQQWRPGDNIGVGCWTNQIVGLDLDVHDDVEGRRVLAELCVTRGWPWPDTLTVATPSGCRFPKSRARMREVDCTPAGVGVLLATGYRPGVEYLAALDGTLDGEGMPRHRGGGPWPTPGWGSSAWIGSARSPRPRCVAWALTPPTSWTDQAVRTASPPIPAWIRAGKLAMTTILRSRVRLDYRVNETASSFRCRSGPMFWTVHLPAAGQ